MQCFGPKGSQQQGKTGTYHNMCVATKYDKGTYLSYVLHVFACTSGYTAFSEILVSILMGTLALNFPLFP